MARKVGSIVGSKEVRVPHARWGGRWLGPLLQVSETVDEDDSSFRFLAEYGTTSAYQVARELNLISSLPAGKWEFGVVDTEKGSELVARRVAA